MERGHCAGKSEDSRELVQLGAGTTHRRLWSEGRCTHLGSQRRCDGDLGANVERIGAELTPRLHRLCTVHRLHDHPHRARPAPTLPRPHATPRV
jgi:hypothetical protein